MKRPDELGTLGIYVHFPWCLSKCPYCDFVAYAKKPEAIDHAGYADAVLEELAMRRSAIPALAARRLASVFFGGGTPSLWDPAQIARVLRGLTGTFELDPDLEISLECDPSSLDEERARALGSAGIGRLSIGVQALDDARLRFLGRIHSAAEAIAAVRAAKRAGIGRLSTDLIYAVAGHAPEVVAREAVQLVELGATHVSAYSLTIEPGTPFGRLAKRGKLPLADDAAMADTFYAIDEALTGVGLEHYEISNYAAPYERARHNVGYWRGADYLGLGAGAYGTLGAASGSAIRYQNHVDPAVYAERVSTKGASLDASVEHLDPATRLRERIMLGLRTREGLDLEAEAAKLGAEPYPGDRRAALDRLEARGRIVRSKGQVSVPREAWIFADDTAASLF